MIQVSHGTVNFCVRRQDGMVSMVQLVFDCIETDYNGYTRGYTKVISIDGTFDLAPEPPVA